MNFVISDVMTVPEVDPLGDARPIRKPKYSKGCFVPLCPNTSKSTPEKMFVTVPVNPARRKLWFDVVGKQNTSKNPKTPFFCCQDHFDLEKEMVNYQQYLTMGGRTSMVLLRTATPSIFVCKQFGHLCRKDRIATLRKLYQENKFTAVPESKKAEDKTDSTRLQSEPEPKNKTTATPFKGQRAPQPAPVRNSVFIEMPVFEDEDKPDYFRIEDIRKMEEVVPVVVIDDSDPE